MAHKIIAKTQKGDCIGNPLTRVHIAGVCGYSRMRDIRIGDRIQGSYIVTAITHIITDAPSDTPYSWGEDWAPANTKAAKL
ncbi:MAG: hypothetical protein KHW42_05755 [Veillonella sp.]|uniref:hypothetical protein n=1 Tax=Veillonella sp. TaxID=1926307 RepID=UPI00257A50E6|nr:hypothetical protein [Veillonella sp.]MBS5716633.1 hypothetical protein [Veillonella sp.]